MVDLRDRLLDLQTMADTNAAAINAQNHQSNVHSQWFMFLASVVAVVILILFSIWNARAITGPLQKMIDICMKLRDGDFRIMPRQVQRADEFGQMADALTDMREVLNKLMKKVSSSAEQLAAASEELTASASQSAQASTQVAESVTNAAGGVAEQQGAVTNSTQSVDKVAVSVDNMRQAADKVAAHSADAAQQADSGRKAIDGSVQQIRSVETTVRDSAEIVDKLGERSQEIGQIVDAISNIAGQTNLLALNAAIEAARAGEHGRGFAVVAEEVRKLAEQSQNAAQQISALISGIQSDTASAVESMRQGREAVGVGAESVENMRSLFDQIHTLIRNEDHQIELLAQSIDVVDQDADNIAHEVDHINTQGVRVSEEMQSVSAATEQQSASAEEIASASDALAKLAQEQQLALQHFKF